MTNKVGWKPEGFMRQPLSVEDIKKLLDELQARIESHFEKYGNGIFCHPHEIVGCMFGQQLKLSKAADESVYTGDLEAFRQRCMKTLLAILCGTASVDKLTELRKSTYVEHVEYVEPEPVEQVPQHREFGSVENAFALLDKYAT